MPVYARVRVDMCVYMCAHYIYRCVYACMRVFLRVQVRVLWVGVCVCVRPCAS